jgi:glutamate dehydrogenase (NADP+)
MTTLTNGTTMSTAVDDRVDEFMRMAIARSPGETEFHQAVKEVVESVLPFVMDHHRSTSEHKVLERLTEPDRIFSFRVAWQNDKGEIEVNRGYRVEFTNASARTRAGCGSTRR